MEKQHKIMIGVAVAALAGFLYYKKRKADDAPVVAAVESAKPAVAAKFVGDEESHQDHSYKGEKVFSNALGNSWGSNQWSFGKN